MAKLLTDKEKSLIISDYKTGQYSQRELAKKHDVSIGTVNKLTKDLNTTNEHLMNAQKALIVAKETLPRDEMNAIVNTAMDLVRKEGLIYGNAELIASKIPAMLQQIDTASDLKLLADTNDRLAITLKVADRHAPKQDINVNATAGVQNNIVVEYQD